MNFPYKRKAELTQWALYQPFHWLLLNDASTKFWQFLPPRFSLWWRSWEVGLWLVGILYILNRKLKPAFLGFLKWMPVLNGPVQSKSTVKELIIGLKRFYDDLWLLYTFIQPGTYRCLRMCKFFQRCVIFTMQIRIYVVLCCTYIQKKISYFFPKKLNSDNVDAKYFVWFCETLHRSYAVHLRSISTNWRPTRKVSRYLCNLCHLKLKSYAMHCRLIIEGILCHSSVLLWTSGSVVQKVGREAAI